MSPLFHNFKLMKSTIWRVFVDKLSKKHDDKSNLVPSGTQRGSSSVFCNIDVAPKNYAIYQIKIEL